MLESAMQDRAGHTFHGRYKCEDDTGRHFGSKPTLSPSTFDSVLKRDHQYEPELAYLCSVIAGWSYADGVTLAKQLKYYGLAGASIEEFAVTNEVMCIVATAYLIRSRCGRIAILSFRGTEPTSVINWLTDADVALRSFHGRGAVHRGFYTNLRSVWGDVSHALLKMMQADEAGEGKGNGNGRSARLERLYITGHSLGGAMAVLAAARILLEGDRRWQEALSGVYTFGQPAVGDRVFAKEFSQPLDTLLFRHEFRADVVPRLPPTATGDFVHVGTVRVAESAGSAWNAPATIARQANHLLYTAVSVLGSFALRRLPMTAKWERALFRYSLLDDHTPSRYIEASRFSLLSY